MIELLQETIEQVQALFSDEQNAIAAVILEEIADERKWDEAFERSQDKLAALADKVRSDIRADRSRDIRTDEL